MTTYKDGQFQNDSTIKHFEFKDNDQLAKDLFLNCKNMTFDHLPLVEIIPEYCFVNCKCQKHVIIPETVKKIGECAFLNCRNITKITLNEGLEELEGYVFEGTGIKEIELPSTLTKFDYTIVSDCDDLEIIRVKNEEQKQKLKIHERYGIKIEIM